MKKTRLKLWVKVVIALLILAIVGLVAIFAFKGNSKSNDKTSQNESTSMTAQSSSETTSKNEKGNTPVKTVSNKVQVRGYCNSFAGYTAALVANGGNTTQPGSYFDQAGLDVNISIEDNDDVIIQDFKDGKIEFFYMTVNKMALVCKELEDAGVDVVIPYFTDTSTGGDGIVANADYQSIESLQNTKIAMARNSASEAIQVWLLNESNLDSNTVQSIINNFALYDSTQDAVDAFVHGEAGAVSTWDMNTALKAEESHLLFSTKDAENLVIDALVVNKEFATKNPDVVEAIIDGSIAVVNDLNNGVKVSESYDVIQTSVPDFANYDDETMKAVLEDAKMLGYKRNLEVFDIAPDIYSDFCTVWQQLGFETDSAYVSKLFDKSYLESLFNKWSNEAVVEAEKVVATEDVVDKQALISQTAQLLFESNSADFLSGFEKENEAMLNEFVKVAKVLNRMVIKIEGNISLSPGTTSNEFDYELSRLRAEHAKEYMVEHGIDSDRIIIVANGGDKPIASNDTAEGRKLNRNCVISFYQGEG